jgi:transposase
LKPWRRQQWCIPSVGAEFVWRMEDVLDLYAQDYDSQRPQVCFDEMPYQLIKEKHIPVPVKPGKPERYDYEYRRSGTRNLFMFFEPHTGWRHVKVTNRRTKEDFAHQMKALVEEYYPKAKTIRVVLDNLNTHTPAALYEAFEPPLARSILSKLEFHYTPKHGSWLNMIEAEFSVLANQCIGGRRIGDEETLKSEIAAWERKRNERKATVEWRFTVDDARQKLKRLYSS